MSQMFHYKLVNVTGELKVNPTMSDSVNKAEMASLHQMRISQVPLRPADPADVNAQNQNQCPVEAEEEGPIEKLSSLDHVRYNIVGRQTFFFLFLLPNDHSS